MPRAPAASLFGAAAVYVLQGGTRAAKTCAASQTANAASPATGDCCYGCTEGDWAVTTDSLPAEGGGAGRPRPQLHG